MGSGKFRAAILAALVLTAAALRIYMLPDISRGFYQDEAVSGIQALDLISGTDRASPFAPRMMFPLWTAIEAPSVALLGMTPLAVRLPAALLGITAVLLALFAGRAVGGYWGALGGAGFLAFSLWHIIYSRIGASPVIVPVAGLVLALFLFGRVPRAPLAAGLFSGLAVGCGLLSYFAGWSLPLVLASGIYLRSRQDAGFRAVAGRYSIGSLAGLASCAAVLAVFNGSFRLGASLVGWPPTGFLSGMGGNLMALFINPWGRDIGPEFWGVYPPGTPFLSPLESLMVVGGAAALFIGCRPGWQGILAGTWLLLGLVPAALAPDGLRYSRAIGALAPLAVFASAGFGWVGSRASRYAPASLVLIMLAHSIWGWRGYFYGYRHDLRVAVWSNSVDVELAQYLVGRSQSTRLAILNPPDSMAVLEFIGWRETRSGRIDFRPGAPASGVLETVIRDPARNQPMMFVFRVPSQERPGETALLLANPDGFLGRAGRAEAEGRWEDASDAYREAIDMVPGFGVAHWRLARVLEKLGRKQESGKERALARRMGAGDAVSDGGR